MTYPDYGTQQIECSKRKCDWTGLESEMKQVPHPTIPSATKSACPKCGNDSYYFIKPKK